MARVLLVPVHLDAMFLPADDQVVEAMVDFSRLPYFDGERDVNGDRPYLSEDLVSRPFQNDNLFLGRGVHLHWALPDALTKAFTRDSLTRFPRVPNRWLVTRTGLGGAAAPKHWVVESDYLHPEGERAPIGISYPVPDALRGDRRQPFRFMGKTFDLDEWVERVGEPSPSGANTGARHLDRLTAIGYGEPSFAAFYPNCHSVFGLHDREMFDVGGSEPVDVLRGVTYDVIGWYHDGSTDALRKGFARFAVEHARDNDGRVPDGEAVRRYLAEWFRWDITETLDAEPSESEDGTTTTRFVPRPLPDDFDLSANLPDRMVCHARITFAPEGGDGKARAVAAEPLEVWVGHSGTEALSARLAEGLVIEDGLLDDADVIEDQIEALYLARGLRDTRIDLGARFRQARHEKSFVGIESGHLWLVRAEAEAGTGAIADTTRRDTQISLPEDLADLLSAVNRLQDEYDRAHHELASRAEHLFGDWYKYMLAAYPTPDALDEYPDIDAVKHFIETRGLEPLERLRAATGTLELAIDRRGDVIGAKASDPAEDAIAVRLARAVVELHAALLRHNVKPWLLRETDVPDFLTLAGALRFRFQLPGVPPDRQLGTPEGRRALLDVVNRALATPTLFTPEHFRNLTLPEPLRAELGQVGPQTPPPQVARLNRLLLEELFFIRRSSPAPPSLLLRRKAAPRYWQPRPPTVLLVGEAARATRRHGQDGRESDTGLLRCHFVELDDGDAFHLEARRAVEDLRRAQDALTGSSTQERIGTSLWTRNPWNPFLLEWEVQVHPFEKDLAETQTAAGREEDADVEAEPDYDRGYLDRNVDVPRDDVELRPRDGARIKADRAASTIGGRSFLTAHPGRLLDEAVRRYFERITDYGERGDEFEDLSIEQWLVHVERETPERLAGERDKIRLFRAVRDRLVNEGGSLPHLAQALSGFDNALLMRRQTFQLPVADPLAFHDRPNPGEPPSSDYEQFATRVASAVGNRNRSAPMPLNPFLPMRCGMMRVSELRLIDTFGQTVSVEPGAVGSSASMRLPERVSTLDPGVEGDERRERCVWLPPRLAQPARLHFRWLSASDGEVEVNEHPATNPICGWLLPNHLDHSLMVYDADGRALGFFDLEGTWRPAPGLEGPVLRDAEPFPPGLFINPRLARVAEVIKRMDPDAFQVFLGMLDQALLQIDPESFSQHADFALLAGRPIAVARASLSLELQGLPAFHQGFPEFFDDLRRGDRETLGFPRIELPVRLGERSQWNDGLLGYWEETEDEIAGAPFRLSQDGHVHQAVDAPPHRMTMLVDPRGSVHVTSGLLPAKAISIPPDQYSAAVRRLRISFLTAPLLTDHDAIQMPVLPREDGFTWSFISSTKTGFVEVPGAEIQEVRYEARFTTTQMLREGWLQLAPVPEESNPDRGGAIGDDQ